MIELILFDVSGVLIELSGVPTLLEWTKGRMDEEELWRRWLASPVVRGYETGQSTADEFALGIVEELQLPVTPQVFLQEFVSWIEGPFPGASDMLRALSREHTLATLSNTNEVYWNNFQESGLAQYFNHHFASHKIGVLKPDKVAFQYVCNALSISPENIVFLDDNLINVTGAKAVGLQAHQVQGAAAARAQLTELGLLSEAGPHD